MSSQRSESTDSSDKSRTTEGRRTRGLSARGEPVRMSGGAVLSDPLLNKGTAFTQEEREALGLRGLMPPRVFSLEEQVERSMEALRRKPDALEKYIYLVNLQNRNEVLFYRLVTSNLEEIVPLIYTPTVGEACLQYGSLFRKPRGLFISRRDRGQIARILRNWPRKGARLIVVTDGERILGLGDLGALGMGIPIGKLSLYTSCAGVHPYYTLPITLDVGTDNEELRNGEFYIGEREPRLKGAEYDAFLEEFVQAVKEVYPRALLQWEDFGNTNAFRLLRRYRSQLPSFNDDIQGTAAVALAGIIAALKVAGGSLAAQRVLFLGAGEAGTGIAQLIAAAARQEGLADEAARELCWFVDSKGLVIRGRGDALPEHKQPFAHEHPPVGGLLDSVRALKPTILVGVSAQPSAFDQQVIAEMSALNQRPIIFALSNPTSKSECTAEQAYRWSSGRAIFASGSAFAPVTIDSRRLVPGQGNNVYVFPGIGLGALASEASEVTDPMFLAAARTLAAQVKPEHLEEGRVFPPINTIREVSIKIATAVAAEAHDEGLARVPRPRNIEKDIRKRMFEPVYGNYA